MMRVLKLFLTVWMVLVLLPLHATALKLVDVNAYRFKNVTAWRSSLQKSTWSFNCVLDCTSANHLTTPAPKPNQTFTSQLVYINCNKQKMKLKKSCLQKVQDLEIIYNGSKPLLALSKQKVKWNVANKFCRSRGLSLITFDDENSTELEVLRQLTSISQYFYAVNLKNIINQPSRQKNELSIKKDTTFSIWTSGTNFAAPRGKFYWRVSGKYINIQRWPGKETRIRCIKWSSEAGIKWKLEDCRNENFFACSVPPSCFSEQCVTKASSCGGPWCPPVPCITDASFFSYKELKVKKSLGRVFYSECGTNYFVSKNRTTFDGARIACCRLGLQLVSLESRSEQTCFANVILGLQPTDKVFNYWTSASDFNCEEKFGWCSSGERLENYYISNFKLNANKTHGKNCITLETSKRDSKWSFVRRNCKELYPYICEGRLRYKQNNYTTMQLFDTYSPCDVSKCPETKCQVDENRENTIYSNLKSFNNNTAACKKNYTYSSKMKNVSEAIRICCLNNMTLLKLETLEEFNCISKLILSETTLKSAIWTSGRGCDFNYWWCSSGESLSPQIPLKTSLISSQSYRMQVQCLSIVTVKNQTKFKEDDCSLLALFICE